ncbi:hypothetical protein J3459_014020 [Metarhizium acridum]|nr:hypothetical protein J3459_014020 [Metarhizium acridum]
MALTAQQIATVKSTAPVVKQYGKTITTTFYKNMLSAHPELKNYFSLKNQQSGAQSAALANAVFAYASYIDDLPKLSGAVERIAQKHASLFIKPDQYPIVGKYLVGAFAEVLGNALTPEVAEAWVAAYGQLADIFIQREKQLYSDAGEWQRLAPVQDCRQGSRDGQHHQRVPGARGRQAPAGVSAGPVYLAADPPARAGRATAESAV